MIVQADYPIALLFETHLLTLTGPGGSGKTRLSLQVAAEVLPEYRDGARVVELAPLADPAYLVPALAGVLDVPESPEHPLLDGVTDYLRARHLLLLPGNCEHLIEACAHLADSLLHACPDSKIIASSREALGPTGETAYRVPSLALPDVDAATPDRLAGRRPPPGHRAEQAAGRLRGLARAGIRLGVDQRVGRVNRQGVRARLEQGANVKAIGGPVAAGQPAVTVAPAPNLWRVNPDPYAPA